jgi:predicted Zn-dependent peptidase
LKQAAPERYEYYILNTVLGAGLSSRLFQEIREKRGLVYTIYSYISAYSDTGLWGVYAGTGQKNLEEVVSLALKYLKELPDDLHESEIAKAKEQLKGNLLLGLESTQSRMQNIAKQEIYFGRYYSPAEVIRDIDSVTLNKLKALAEKLLRGKSPALTALGPVEPKLLGKTLPTL